MYNTMPLSHTCGGTFSECGVQGWARLRTDCAQGQTKLRLRLASASAKRSGRPRLQPFSGGPLSRTLSLTCGMATARVCAGLGLQSARRLRAPISALHPLPSLPCGEGQQRQYSIKPLSFDVLRDMNRAVTAGASEGGTAHVPAAALERCVEAATHHGLTYEGLLTLDVALAQPGMVFSPMFYACAAKLRHAVHGEDSLRDLIISIGEGGSLALGRAGSAPAAGGGGLTRPFLDRMLLHCVELRAHFAAVGMFRLARARGVLPSPPVHRAVAEAVAASPAAGDCDELVASLRKRGIAPPTAVYNAHLRDESLVGSVSDAEAVLRRMAQDGAAPDADTAAAVVQLGVRLGPDVAGDPLRLVQGLSARDVSVPGEVSVDLMRLLLAGGLQAEAVQHGQACLASGVAPVPIVTCTILALVAAGRGQEVPSLWAGVPDHAGLLAGVAPEALWEVVRTTAEAGHWRTAIEAHLALLTRRCSLLPEAGLLAVVRACGESKDAAHLQRIVYFALAEGVHLPPTVAHEILATTAALSPNRCIRCLSLLRRQRPAAWDDAAVALLGLLSGKSQPQAAWQVLTSLCVRLTQAGHEVDPGVAACTVAALRQAGQGKAPGLPEGGAVQADSLLRGLLRWVRGRKRPGLAYEKALADTLEQALRGDIQPVEPQRDVPAPAPPQQPASLPRRSGERGEAGGDQRPLTITMKVRRPGGRGR